MTRLEAGTAPNYTSRRQRQCYEGVPNHATTSTGVPVEQAAREVAGVTRGQNAVYVMPHDWASIAQFLGPLLDRVDDAVREVQVVIITP
jgi:hypothetical protein